MHRRSFLALTGATALCACATRLNTTPTEAADLGTPTTSEFIIEQMSRPGRLGFEKVVVADWHFPNTTRPPGDSDWMTRELDAQIYFYAIRHPERGLYLIDAGMPANYERHMGAILRNAVRDTYDFSLRVSTDAWVRENGAPLAAFITHLHYDHVLGVAVLDRATPVYIGPNDGAHRSFFYRFINQPTREALEGHSVRTWRFGPAPEGGLAALDVFGDGSLFALHVPGHTPGSTAYLVNSTQGPQLVTGDAVHSREGWTGELEEATGFETDLAQIFASRRALQALAAGIAGLTVHPGHQSLLAEISRE
ncbi:MAG: hypothetical protein A4S17_00525 [Proteobacteria bacterium HN_bin10]|nr:MAG: hypothetical protein A4S17_00525 [Proteobacteria bacterium HN_bin10]